MDLPAGSATAREHQHEVPLASGCAVAAAALPNDNNRPLAHMSIEQQRLQSGRNRLGTPRHEQRAAAAGRNCDTQTQNQISIRRPQPDGQDSSVSVASTSSTPTVEMSSQAPPSYGTATRSCLAATLDAGQLYQIQMERQRQLVLARAQQQQQQMASSSWQDTSGPSWNPPAAAEHINQTAGRRHYRLSNFESCATAVRPPVSCAHSLGNLAAILRHQQQQQQTVAVERQAQRQPIDDSYGFLSRAGGRHRRPCADKDQRPAQLAATLARCGSQVSRPPKKQEEGIYATLNVAPAVARLPINHVISGRASMQLERQQAHALQWAAVHNCARDHDHKPQLQSQQHEQTNQLAGAQLAEPRGRPTTLASFDCATTATTDRLIDISSSSGSTSSYSPCGGGGGGGIGQPATTNVDSAGQTLRHCAPNSFVANTDAVTSDRNSSTPTCQNNDFASRAPLGGVMAATTGSGKDDARGAHDGAKCDKNRKGHARQRLDEIPGGGGGDLATFAAGAINYGEQAKSGEQTSGRNNANNQTGGANVTSQQQQQQQPQTGPTTISAHCWLIDSGDELRNGASGGAAPESAAAVSHYDAAHSAHLEPRARSIDRLERAAGRKLAPARTKSFCQTLKPGLRRVHQQATCVAASLSSPNVTYNRSDDDERDEATTDCEERQRRATPRRHRRRTRTSRTTSRRPAAAGGRSSASSPYENASTVVRLSAVLNFVSNLVSGRARSRQRSTSSKSTVDRAPKVRYASAAASTSSYSNRTLPGQSYTTTGANSMAYSSSTSAYVTGNSSLHSHDCHSSSLLHVPAPSLASQSSPRDRTSPFVSLRRGDGLADGRRPPDEGRQQLYTVSIPSTAVSHHSYEYCDDLPATSARAKKVYDCSAALKPASSHIPVEHLELTTMNNREQPWTSEQPAGVRRANSCDSRAASCSEMASQSSNSIDRATCSPAQMVGIGQTGSTGPGRPLGQTLMSDCELISSAASCGRLPPASRRRWWWNSFKLWLTRRACPDTRGLPVFSTDDDDGSLTHQRPAGPPNGLSGTHAAAALPVAAAAAAASREPASRYRCLESGVGGPNSPRDNFRRVKKPGTLQNVISLAKVDRVFRCRLLASLAISLLLLALICMLALMIYKRGSLHNHLSNGRLGLNTRSRHHDQPLLTDSDDFDLSWLWPAQQQQQQHRPIHEFGEHKQLPLPPPPYPDGHDLDGQLRSLLHVIDRSERIQQFQLAVTHLTNLQLANDHFIDLSQLAQLLQPEFHAANRTAAYNDTSSPYDETTNRTAVNQLELDLASLTLLSNLYWPLVKWRHQSQRSLAANFLSFALASASGRDARRGGPGEGDAGAAALRNLLASLILVESFNPDNLDARRHAASSSTPTHVNLQQFQRLNQNLRLAAYHLLTCPGELRDPEESHHHQHLGTRARFCQLLTRRYKRMMLALGELEHGELAELHRREQSGVELPASVHGTTARDKNILGFLLDRLALLDVRLLAELTLASKRIDNLNDDDDDPDLGYRRETGGQREPEASAPQLEIELLVTNQQQIDANSGALLQQLQPGRVGENSGAAHLYELVKSTVGDNPVNLLVASRSGEESDAGSGASYQELQLDAYLRRFDQLRSEQPDRWYDELLVADLINPWPVRALPSFVDALNYDLFLHPNLTSRLVLGMNKIEFELTRPTRFLVLNCAHLNVIELALWMKQPPVSPPPSPPADSGSGRDTSSQAEITANHKQDKRQIAVRRVLNLAGSEMLFIELQETIEPFSSWPVAKQVIEPQRRAEFATSSMANGVEFGELPAQSDRFHASSRGAPVGTGGAFVRNQFALNISFNKTSLAARHQADSRAAVEFVRYADYYSAQVSPQFQPSQAPEHPLVAEDGTAAGSFMFTKFSAGADSQTRGQARHLFPCWDEPSYGAKFQLNLVHEHSSQVLFTGQKRERLPYNSQGSLQMTVFEQTPVPLSPSLLALVVADDLHSAKSLTSRHQPPVEVAKQQQTLHHHQQQHQQHIQVQIWAHYEQLGQTEFASQQLVPQLLAFYQAHLEFAYPLDKIDLVAVPQNHDLRAHSDERAESSAGGLGLLHFRQPARLLVDVNLASQDQIEQVAAGVSHQLARQFFGNIVSSAPGTRGPLEALSEYLGGVALAQVEPEWRLDEQFQLGASVHATLESEQLADLIAGSPTVWARQLDLTLTGGATGTESAASLELDLDGANANDAPPKGRSETTRGKHSALVHMMLATLLPTQEARARLLRLCLQAHQYRTMSGHQFWRHFDQLLRAEPAAHDGRLDLAKVQRVSRDDEGEGNPGTATDHLVHVYTETPPASEPAATSLNATSSTSFERVVFVSPRKRNRKQSPNGVRKPQALRPEPETRRPRADLWLGRAADQWLEQASFPLITASCYRDHLQLRQDAFRPLASKWLSPTGAGSAGTADGETTARNKRDAEARDSIDEQPPVWPIPLLFVSRLNPRTTRFVWLAEREAEVSLLGGGGDSSGADSSSPGAAHPQVVLDHGTATSSSGSSGNSNRLPQQYSWFKLNHNGSSLVRVNYDERNWEALTSLLARAHYSNHLLNPLDRANLLDDAMTLMRHGQLSVSLAMNLTLYLELGERDYQPWSTVLRHFDRLQTLLNQNPLWHQYVLKLLQPIGIVVGWKDDGPHLMRKLRRELYALAIAYGDEKILARARQEFRAWMSRSNQFLVPNLQELVYVAGVKYGDQAEWFHCWQKYQQLAGGGGGGTVQPAPVGVKFASAAGTRQQVNATTAQAQLLQVAAAARNKHMASGGVGGKRLGNRELDEDLTGGATTGSLENEKLQLLTALASTQNTWLLEQFLNYSLDSTKIQPHHLGHVLATLGKNPVARLYLWRFVRLNWFHLEERFLAAEPSVLESMILAATRHFASELDYEEVSAFFESKWPSSAPTGKWPLSQVKRAIQASLAAIRANIRWRNSVEPRLTRWLSHYNNIAAA